MRDVSLWRDLSSVAKTVIERQEFDEDAEVLVASVRPSKRQRGRCGYVSAPDSTTTPGQTGGAGGHWTRRPRGSTNANGELTQGVERTLAQNLWWGQSRSAFAT